jgi:crossover junction endodeoxyribonuclease RusA
VSHLLGVTVYGVPAPQGSKRAIRNQHTGRIQQVESSAKVAPWRADVRQAVLDASNGSGPTLRPVTVRVDFVLPRPKGHYRTGRYAGMLRDSAPAHPAGKPDLDKLVRAVLDAIGSTGAVWHDDSQVIDIEAGKHYPSVTTLDRPGAIIHISEVVS